MNIEDIKKTLNLMPDEEKRLVLGNKKIKELIINERLALLSFIKERPMYEVLYLLDSEGISLLKNMSDLAIFLEKFIKSEIKDSHILFQNEELFDIFYKNKYVFLSCASFLSYESAMIFISKMKNDGSDYLLIFIKDLIPEVQLDVIKSVKLGEDKLVKYISYFHDTTINYLIETNKNPYFLEKINSSSFYYLSQKDVDIKSKLSTNLVNKMASSMDVNFYRSVMNNLSINHDISKIEEKRCKFVDSFLLEYDENLGILNFHKDLFENISNPDILTYIDDVYTFSKTEERLSIYDKIYEIVYNEKTSEGLTFFQDESSNLIKDLIIDYHFNDYPHTVYVDIRILLIYNEEQNYTMLTDAKKEIYTKIMELSSLDYKEMIELHNKLKALNISTQLYEDIRKSKNVAYTNILDCIIKEEDNKFYDETLSNEYGVDILSLEGEPFYALVRSTKTSLCSNLDKILDDAHDCSCYSLINEKHLMTYREVTDYFTLVCTDFNINNVLHTFPTDSFSHFTHDLHKRGGRATTRSNQIHNPDELISLSKYYNEIILLQKGNTTYVKENPKISYILCHDEIKPNIVSAAKKLSLGILLINTKKYKTELNVNGKSLFDYNYNSNNDPDIYQHNNENPLRSK